MAQLFTTKSLELIIPDLFASIVFKYKHKLCNKQQYTTLELIYKNIKDNNIQFGNLIFYNFNIPAIKRKLKKEIYKISI